MKEALINFSIGDNEEFEKIWNVYREMKHMGFINDDEWNRFWKECTYWKWILTPRKVTRLINTNTNKAIAEVNPADGMLLIF